MRHTARIKAFVREMKNAKAGDKLNVGGVPVTVVSDEQAEKADFVVCMRGSASQAYFPSVDGECAECKAAIHWSLKSPKTPKKICMVCFEQRTRPVSKAEVVH